VINILSNDSKPFPPSHSLFLLETFPSQTQLSSPFLLPLSLQNLLINSKQLSAPLPPSLSAHTQLFTSLKFIFFPPKSLCLSLSLSLSVSVSVSCSYLPSKSSFLSLQNLYLSSFFFFFPVRRSHLSLESSSLFQICRNPTSQTPLQT